MLFLFVSLHPVITTPWRRMRRWYLYSTISRIIWTKRPCGSSQSPSSPEAVNGVLPWCSHTPPINVWSACIRHRHQTWDAFRGHLFQGFCDPWSVFGGEYLSRIEHTQIGIWYSYTIICKLMAAFTYIFDYGGNVGGLLRLGWMCTAYSKQNLLS